MSIVLKSKSLRAKLKKVLELNAKRNDQSQNQKRVKPVKEVKQKAEHTIVTIPETTGELTDAQARMESAQFRWLNEKLYTTTGQMALQFFKEDPTAFVAYHTGFRRQVSKWPMNPVEVIVNKLKKDIAKSKSKPFVIADLGCGEAKIAQVFLAEKNSGVQVHSFDLVAVNEHVTICDITHLPLEKESVDAVVFCLSLMGTNFVRYLMEASRVLKIGGVLHIAEVESRFQNKQKFANILERLGFVLRNKKENKYFHLFELIKEDDQELSTPQQKRMVKAGSVILKPCVYKKR
jgi:ribosomal RNA-processing protein 8